MSFSIDFVNNPAELPIICDLVNQVYADMNRSCMTRDSSEDDENSSKVKFEKPMKRTDLETLTSDFENKQIVVLKNFATIVGTVKISSPVCIGYRDCSDHGKLL